MRKVQITAASINTIPMDWDRNGHLIALCIDEAALLGTDIILFPELSLSGYGCEDMFSSPMVWEESWRRLQSLVEGSKGRFLRTMMISVGLPVYFRNAVFNCAALIYNGKVVGLVPKRHLCGDGIHYEPRWFKPWPKGLVSTYVTPDGDQIPIGDLHFDVGGIRIGYEICEDAWVADRPGSELSKLGCDIILNASASHFAFGKQSIRRRFCEEGSRAFGVVYVFSNLLGNESGRAIFDGGSLIASGGGIISQAKRFSFQDAQNVTAVVDLEDNRSAQSRIHSFRPDLDPEKDRCVKVTRKWQVLDDYMDSDPDSEPSPMAKGEEFARAVALGLHDYQRKCRSNGFVISLSGGADSGAVALLSRLSAEMAIDEIGFHTVKDRLGYPESISAEDFYRRLIYCAYQPSDNSGVVTRAAAETVATSIGATFQVLDISGVVDEYTRIIQGALGRDLTWDRDDIALQNIQARVRSPSIWMMANIRNSLLLSTSNRSESAVGYATMDGDTSGGLAPIAGIDKAYLRDWLRWMQDEGFGVYRFPWLKCITAQAPTAELRPADQVQTDEDDLMPFSVLDAVEKWSIRDKKSPLDVYRYAVCRFDGQYDKAALADWVLKFFTLWARNQWKRERYSISFHLDDENLDPKTWCRFPVLSSGYCHELEELRYYLSISE